MDDLVKARGWELLFKIKKRKSPKANRKGKVHDVIRIRDGKVVASGCVSMSRALNVIKSHLEAEEQTVLKEIETDLLVGVHSAE